MCVNLNPYILFGSIKPFIPPPWTTTDDRIRGGSSTSHLDALPNNCARFHGHLDTSTLGGAGFASQFSPEDGRWDLSEYDGIELEFQEGDQKVYTLIVKDDEMSGKRDDGRERAGLSWEVEFRGYNKEGAAVGNGEGCAGEKSRGSGSTKVWVPWSDFKATYRGKEKKDAGKLKIGEVGRVGIMMRSYFGMQDGDFGIELKCISARMEIGEDHTRRAGVLMRDAGNLLPQSKTEDLSRPKDEEKHSC